MSPHRKVFLIKEGIFADLIVEGLYASRIQYVFGGTLYDVWVESDDYLELNEMEELEEEEE